MRTAVPPAWTAIGITELTFPKQLVEMKVVEMKVVAVVP